MNGRESAMVTIIIIHNCKRPGHIKKDCNPLMKIRIRQVPWRTAQENGVHTINLTATRTRTAISSSRSQQTAMIIIDGARITRAEATQIISAITKKNGSRSSPADSKRRKDKTFVAYSNVTGCDSFFSVNVKGKIVMMKVTTSRIPHHLEEDSRSRCVILPYLKKLTASNSWYIQGCSSISLIQSWFVG